MNVAGPEIRGRKRRTVPYFLSLPPFPAQRCMQSKALCEQDYVQQLHVLVGAIRVETGRRTEIL